MHMAQLMPLPLTVSCFSKIQIGFTFLVTAHLGSPGKGTVKRVCVCVCCRSEQPAERPAQAADEGFVRGTVSHSSRETQLVAAISADADGPSRLCSQWLSDSHQPGETPSLSVSSFTTTAAISI